MVFLACFFIKNGPNYPQYINFSVAEFDKNTILRQLRHW